MTKTTEHRFIRALNRLPVDRTPAWIMRQAGRYMPQYRALREQAGSFLALCENPELACAATMLPIQQYPLDAAILFSDILLIPQAMGLGLEFVTHEGPVIRNPVCNARDVDKLKHVDPEQDLGFVSAAIKLIVKALDHKVPLIGFAGSPWTVASYIVEGQTSKHFYKLKGLMYSDPKTMHRLLAHMTEQITNALLAQIKAGVETVMVFDSWGGILTNPLYEEFSLRYMAQIVHDIKQLYPNMPIILFSKNGGRSLLEIAATGCNAIGLDWTADLGHARALVGDKVALQGNLDPCVLYADDSRIIEEVKHLLAQWGTGPGHIFNLGHGIPLDVNPDKVHVLLNALTTYSPQYHKPLIAV